MLGANLDCIIKSLVWFKDQVNHNAVWDYKRENRTSEWLTAHGVSMVTINAVEMNMAEYGNWDDDPHDWEMIDAGVELAKQYQENGILRY